MKITVILCTFNRSQSLARALASVANSKVPDHVAWEVSVVDNNSRDQTRAVVEEFCCRYPGRFRYLFEPRQGLSHARNHGIREAQGDILAFMDDDVAVEPTWLRNLTTNLEDSEWAGAGGRILPERSFSPPSWLSLDGPYAMGGVLDFFDRGEKPGEIDWPPYGTNMAFRRQMFEKYGVFRTDLGRCGDDMLCCEDTEFGRRLVAAGERLRYEPSAIVYHPVPENRLHKRYFLAWYFGLGRSKVRELGRGPEIWGIPRAYFSILRKGLMWLLALRSQERFFYKANVWRMAGEIVETRRVARYPDKPGTAIRNCNAS